MQGGETIQKISRESFARINIEDYVAGAKERVVTVTGERCGARPPAGPQLPAHQPACGPQLPGGHLRPQRLKLAAAGVCLDWQHRSWLWQGKVVGCT